MWLALIVGGSLTFLIIGSVNSTIGDERASPMHGEIDGMSWWAFIQGINLVSSNMVAANLQKCLRETKMTAQSPEVESSALLEIPGIPFWKSWKSLNFLGLFLSVFPVQHVTIWLRPRPGPLGLVGLQPWDHPEETVPVQCRILPGFLRIVSLSNFWWFLKKWNNYDVLKYEIVSKYIKYEWKSNIAP